MAIDQNDASYKYNQLMIEGQISDIRTPFEYVLSCIQRRELNPKLSVFLSQFIKGGPSKKEIEEISLAFLKSKKEGLHFRQITDHLIVILKLLLNFVRNQQEDNLEERFNEKLKTLKNKLKNSEVQNWIVALREQIKKVADYNDLHKDVRHLRKLCEKAHEIQVNFENMKRERDAHYNSFKKVALKLFDTTQVQKRINSLQFQEVVITSVQKLKEKLKQKEQATKRQQQIISKLVQIGKKNNIKSSDPTAILDQLDYQVKDLTVKLSFVNKRLENLKEVQSEKEERIANLRLRLEKYDQEIKMQKDRVEQLQAKQQESFCRSFLNSSEIIPSNKTIQISFLRKAIKEVAGVEGTKCKLLYTSAQSKGKNFHEFIDNKPNILLLVQLKNGTIIGGFSHEQFRQRCSGEQGFIFSITQLETYERQQRSSISYDDYYLIFGSSEICIKVNDMLILSNFGMQSRNFNNKGRDVSFFLGSNKRQIQMKAYEIYQVITD